MCAHACLQLEWKCIHTRLHVIGCVFDMLLRCGECVYTPFLKACSHNISRNNTAGSPGSSLSSPPGFTCALILVVVLFPAANRWRFQPLRENTPRRRPEGVFLPRLRVPWRIACCFSISVVSLPYGSGPGDHLPVIICLDGPKQLGNLFNRLPPLDAGAVWIKMQPNRMSDGISMKGAAFFPPRANPLSVSALR